MWKDSETDLDFLDFDYLIGILDELIKDESLLPSSIGVYGDWGSGKSSLIRMSMKRAEQRKGTACLIFNGWLFEGYEDAKTALMGSILDTIQDNQTLTDKAEKSLAILYKSVDKFKLAKKGLRIGLDMALTGGVGSILEMSTKGLIDKVKDTISKDNLSDEEEARILDAIKDELTYKELREDIKEFQNKFAELLEECNISRLLVFIDELDRCSPDTILETLEAIRLFLFTGNSIFIVGADERHISYAVKRKFDEIEGQHINIGKEYLEKIIQYPIRIPRMSSQEMKFYITCLLFEKELESEEFNTILDLFAEEKNKDFFNFSISFDLINENYPESANKVKESILIAEQISDVLAQGLNGNPRHCKRFLNSLVMREKMSSFKNIQLDRKVLAKLMMLEYFKPSLFKQLAEYQGNDMNIQLSQLEKNELNEDNSLKIWGDDRWVRNWCEIDPPIAEVDLIPYFYFSRDILNNKAFGTSNKLSTQANKILEQLTRGSETARKQAIKDSVEINDFEAIEIARSLFEKILSKSSIDMFLLKSYLEWGKVKEELYSNVLNDIGSLPGEKITLPMVPLIIEFVKQTNQLSLFIEIKDKWNEGNSAIVQAINKSIDRGDR
ncbi:P-loop NTPase fold protein [Bacillus sp. I-2]|uniref:KAP family P-loop NTPase fold protein n=1 Tax=Bacillus sp. I-2 TaxID=1857572 RepID=UPI0009758C63|nr:P-loop NTPase fold protein [Bacillus sp. I-2]OMP29203.1 NTPase [Bacillus sp. I-2]